MSRQKKSKARTKRTFNHLPEFNITRFLDKILHNRKHMGKENNQFVPFECSQCLRESK